MTNFDYLDSCASVFSRCFRCFSEPVLAGDELDLGIELVNTCD